MSGQPSWVIRSLPTGLWSITGSGSATKRARFVGRLARQGIDAEKPICPIGLPGIEGKEPAVVAVAVAAQILQFQPSQWSISPMSSVSGSCGDCVCPPVSAQARR
jgi:hypothetical protein